MKLTITRHGQTEENLKGITQGHLPGKLSKLGIEQAKKLALRLKDEKFDVIFSSDLKRAKDTVKEILKYHKKVPVYYTEELRERNYGDFEGLKEKEVDWSSLKGDFYTNKPKNGESFSDVILRVKKFLDDLHKKYFGKRVLIVGHGCVNIILKIILFKEHLNDITKYKLQKHTAVDILEIDEQKNPKVHLINCTKHLE